MLIICSVMSVATWVTKSVIGMGQDFDDANTDHNKNFSLHATSSH
jgi:hypothetical protein